MNKDLIIHALRKEIESLKDSLEKEQLARAAAEEAYNELQTKHAMMGFHYDNLKRMVFQSRSERSSVIADQSTEHGKVIDMFDAATEARLREDFAGIAAEIEAREKEIEEKIEAGSGKKKKKTTYKPTGRQAFGEHLLRKYTYEDPKGIDLSKATLVGHDKTEVLNYTPATIWVDTYVRNKYIIKDEETGTKTFHQAPALQRPIDRISAGPSLLASLIVEKYVYHLPIHRQLAKFKRLGCIIAAGTASGWLDKVQELLMPLYEALKTEVLSTDSLQADESTIGVLGIKPGKLHTGYMWLYRDTKKRLVLFDFAMGRAAKYPIGILKDYKGYLQVDGYSAYEVAEIGGRHDIFLLYCHTHARRYFVKSLDYDAVRASYYISEIGKVYAIEDKIVELNLTGVDKVAYREKYAQPILEQLKVWLEQQKKEVLPNSPIGIAINYALSRWDGLMIYLHNPDLQICNNLIENAVRPLALGRRNWLFAGSQHGGKRNALMYSLISCCIQHDIDPYTYFVDVINRIGSHKINEVKELLPHNWKPLNENATVASPARETA